MVPLDPENLAIEDHPFFDRVTRYLDDDLDEIEFAALQEELRDNPERQDVLMQLSAQHVLLTQHGAAMLSAGENTSTTIWDRRRLRIAAIGIAAAAATVLAMLLSGWLKPAPSLHLTGVAAASFAQPPGNDMTEVHLMDGYAEFSTDGGARILTTGNTHLDVAPDGIVYLHNGQLFVEVPEGAASVKIVTPQATILDIGTRFGVASHADRTELHVFDGQVAILKNPQATVDQAVMVVGGGEAVAIHHLDQPGGLLRIQSAMNRFASKLPQEIPIPIVNTGIHRSLGDSDANWAIIKLPSDPGSMLQHAAVVTHSRYEPNAPDRSQWLSATHPLPKYPSSGSYRFRTVFELNGIDPESAVLTGRFWVDNYVSAIKLNGVENPIPEQDDAGFNHEPGREHSFTITESFRNGLNILDFDVINRMVDGKLDNPIAFRCELSGTARVVHIPPPSVAR